LSNIRRAVVLAAGIGSRLRPLTDEVPKCLTEVNGRPIPEQILDILEKNGIQETALVVGYLGDIVVRRIGHRYRSMKVACLWNTIYDKTNTVYSAWLAREDLESGAILIEGDTVFEEALIQRLLDTPSDRAVWAGDKFRRGYLGSMSIVDSTGRIVDLKIIREELIDYRDNCYKSTGVLKRIQLGDTRYFPCMLRRAVGI